MTRRTRYLPLVLIAAGLWLAAGALTADELHFVAPEVHLFDDATAYLGINAEEELEHPDGGARITSVAEDSPAGRAGLTAGDVIVRFDGHVVRGPAALTGRIHDRAPGDRVEIQYLRDGRKQSVSVELADRASQWRGLLRVPEPDGRGLGGLEWLPGGSGYSIGWGRPKLGVQLVETTPELREHLGGDADAGVLISKVLRNTPAAGAGIRVGDLILTVGGTKVASARALREALDEIEGQTARVRLVREGKTIVLDVTFAEADEDRPTGPRAGLLPPPLPAVAPTPPDRPRPAPPVMPDPPGFAPAPRGRPVPAVAPVVPPPALPESPHPLAPPAPPAPEPAVRFV